MPDYKANRTNKTEEWVVYGIYSVECPTRSEIPKVTSEDFIMA